MPPHSFMLNSKNAMETKIQIAKKGQAQDCLICVKNSNLWDVYYKTNPYHESTLEEMI